MSLAILAAVPFRSIVPFLVELTRYKVCAFTSSVSAHLGSRGGVAFGPPALKRIVFWRLGPADRGLGCGLGLECWCGRTERRGCGPSAGSGTIEISSAGGLPFPSSYCLLLPKPLLEDRSCLLLIELNDLLQVVSGERAQHFSGRHRRRDLALLARKLGGRTGLGAQQAGARARPANSAVSVAVEWPGSC